MPRLPPPARRWPWRVRRSLPPRKPSLPPRPPGPKKPEPLRQVPPARPPTRGMWPSLPGHCREMQQLPPTRSSAGTQRCAGLSRRWRPPASSMRALRGRGEDLVKSPWQGLYQRCVKAHSTLTDPRRAYIDKTSRNQDPAETGGCKSGRRRRRSFCSRCSDIDRGWLAQDYSPRE